SPRVAGSSAFVPARYAAARPAGALAFGGRPAPNAAPAAKPQPSAAPASKTASGYGKPPGQRVRPVPRQDGPAVERAIKRGFQAPPSKPGQEVFASFDAAKAKQRKEDENATRAADSDEVWEIRRITVPAVISTRKVG
ncbi:MAG: hypothetical protein ACRD0P_17130, partial [Stackebrandtia sp.]